jgi:hypothetical protein
VHALDPAEPRVYAAVAALVRDWRALFDDASFHIGTDEVPEQVCMCHFWCGADLSHSETTVYNYACRLLREGCQ